MYKDVKGIIPEKDDFQKKTAHAFHYGKHVQFYAKGLGSSMEKFLRRNSFGWGCISPELIGIQLFVQPVICEQFLMRAALGNTFVRDDNDFVSVFHCG